MSSGPEARISRNACGEPAIVPRTGPGSPVLTSAGHDRRIACARDRCALMVAIASLVGTLGLVAGDCNPAE